MSDSETQRTAAHQTPLSMGFSRQQHWRELPHPPPGDLPDLGIKPTSLMSPTLAGRFFTSRATWEALDLNTHQLILTGTWVSWLISLNLIFLTCKYGDKHIHGVIGIQLNVIRYILLAQFMAQSLAQGRK